ncbi:ABC transporter ATP-binding protein [Gryllotalpicola protaetiae]|uniref:ABC transporter ATP-binding protein n=1 Tax=Gryllotalpicola protaetiae TaxID=2419771 RepID=A0A387BRI5_9MICO|nr:ABC transporter ATP-binding protein [Gryllotalpicola protaetiae]
MLSVRDLAVSFRRDGRETRAVRGVDLDLHSGRTLVLLGESGSGKSVTSNAILGLHSRSATISGAIELDGVDLTRLDEDRLRRLRGGTIGTVPQDPSAALDPLRRVGDQIAEVVRLHGDGVQRSRARAAALDLLAQVGIVEPARTARSLPFELSGGMRQRVAIAIAIARRPRVLIADEPTTALDVTVQAQILELFAALQRELDLAILLVTHDVGVARMLGHDVAVMYAGRVVERGPVERVLLAPRHPYTAGLLAAMPSPQHPRGRLPVIPGLPPGPDDALADESCAFAPRCASAVSACTAHRPPLAGDAEGRAAACDVPAAAAHAVPSLVSGESAL